jgi:hypothetical protein
MDVSRQLHALTALLLGKEPPMPIEYEVGWAPELARILRRREKYLALLGIKLQPSSP